MNLSYNKLKVYVDKETGEHFSASKITNSSYTFWKKSGLASEWREFRKTNSIESYLNDVVGFINPKTKIISNFFEYIKPRVKVKKGSILVRKMVKEDIQDCLDLKYEFFAKYYGSKKTHDSYILNKFDLETSIVAIHGEEIVGVYFTRESIAPHSIKYVLPNGLGLEGISLAVRSEYHGNGIGNMLKDYHKDEGKYPFIYGMAYGSLGNIDDWLKRRVLIGGSGDDRGVNTTIEVYDGKPLVLKPKRKSKFNNKNRRGGYSPHFFDFSD
jgi:hypothetical protein